MNRIVSFICLLLLLLVIGCASLTEGGKNVQIVTKQEAPQNCKLIGDIAIGEVYDGSTSIADTMVAMSIGQLKVKMRNQAAEKGANFLVIDTIERKSDGYAGTGRAYLCK
jgi:hypothetical protein